MPEVLFVTITASVFLAALSLRRPEILFVNLCTQFFLYYFFMWLVFDRYYERESLLFWLGFIFISFFLAIGRHRAGPIKWPAVNLFYLTYFFLFISVYLFYFNADLLSYKFYGAMPFFAAVAFLVPIFFSSFFDKPFLERFLNLLEKSGYLIGAIIIVLYFSGVLSKETGRAYEVSIDSALRYAPVKGFFSIRQAVVLSLPIIISLSRFVFNEAHLSGPRLILFLINLFGLVLSGTRGVVLCLFLFFSYIFIRLKLQMKLKVFLLLLPLVVGLPFLLGETRFFNRIFMPESYLSVIEGLPVRVSLFLNGVAGFLNYPLWGNGGSSMGPVHGFNHNALLSILEYTGLLGIFVWFLFALYYRNIFILPPGSRDVVRFCARNVLAFLAILSLFYGVFAMDYVLLFFIYLYVFVFGREGTAVNPER